MRVWLVLFLSAEQCKYGILMSASLCNSVLRVECTWCFIIHCTSKTIRFGNSIEISNSIFSRNEKTTMKSKCNIFYGIPCTKISQYIILLCILCLVLWNTLYQGKSIYYAWWFVSVDICIWCAWNLELISLILMDSFLKVWIANLYLFIIKQVKNNVNQ